MAQNNTTLPEGTLPSTSSHGSDSEKATATLPYGALAALNAKNEAIIDKLLRELYNYEKKGEEGFEEGSKEGSEEEDIVGYEVGEEPPTDERDQIEESRDDGAEKIMPMQEFESSLNTTSFCFKNDDDVNSFVDSFICAVSASGKDIDSSVEKWFNSNDILDIDNEIEKEKLMKLFLGLGGRIKPLSKASRAGLFTKILLTLFITYSDFVTDLLVAKSYHERGKSSIAYWTAGLCIMAIEGQAVLTFEQYKNREMKERLMRTAAGAVGLGPLLEGYRVWTGGKSSDCMLTAATMFSILKVCEIAFEAIPETIIQLNALIATEDKDEIQLIQVASVLISVLAAAFIVADSNFVIDDQFAKQSPGDPYYGWAPKGDQARRWICILGLFLFLATFFLQFVFCTSLISFVWGKATLLFILSSEFLFCTAYMHFIKGELFGFSDIPHPSFLNLYIYPIIITCFSYLIMSACPLMILASPQEFGPEVSAGLFVWRFVTNLSATAYALFQIQGHGFLSFDVGFKMYLVTLTIQLCGLLLFITNLEEDFDKKLMWKPVTGKRHGQNCWEDEKIWEKKFLTKDEERYYWVSSISPVYLPFEAITQWIWIDLVVKYEDKTVERPEWMKDEDSFIKRIVALYRWRDDSVYIQITNDALYRLFGKTAFSKQDLNSGGLLRKLKTFKRKATKHCLKRFTFVGGASKISPSKPFYQWEAGKDPVAIDNNIDSGSRSSSEKEESFRVWNI